VSVSPAMLTSSEGIVPHLPILFNRSHNLLYSHRIIVASVTHNTDCTIPCPHVAAVMEFTAGYG